MSTASDAVNFVESLPAFVSFADAAIDRALGEAAGNDHDDAVLSRARSELIGEVRHSALGALATNARAEGAALELLALLVACEIDPVRAARVGMLAGSTKPSRLTFGIAARLLGGTAACAEAAGPGSPLRRAAFIETEQDGPWATAEIVLSPSVIWALAGDQTPDPRLPPGSSIHQRPEPDRPEPRSPGQAAVVFVSGPDRVRRRIVAMERCPGPRHLVCRVPASEAGWAAIVREATITGSSVVVELDEGLPDEGRWWIGYATHLSWAVTSADELPLRDLPDRDRIECTATGGLASSAEWHDVFGSDVAHSHRLTAEQLELVATAYPAVGSDIDVAVRRLLAGPLVRLARRVRPNKSWSDIVLSEAKLAQLRAIAARYRHASLVLDNWGMADVSARGIVALFSGQSGTGKTLAAEIIASSLGLDMYRIDLSSVVSKCIGETEQNLEKVFAAASAGSSVLFFDEADSLFGKRSEVRDSRDRYANLEVSYLLQRLENYDGVVVLATNMPKNIDDAFLRRIHVIVHFPLPGVVERKAIWQRHFGDRVPCAELDFDLLAERYEISGGIIRNAAVSAAFHAADDGQPVTMAHVMAALVSEYTKLGRLIKEEVFDAG